MTHGGVWCIGLAALLACGGPPEQKLPVAGSATTAAPADSLVLTSSAGLEVWFTLARIGRGTDGNRCVERGLEIRNGDNRVKVPLLYTGAPPVLLNDSTMRAVLWTHCQPGNAYLVNLRTGQPSPEGRGSTS